MTIQYRKIKINADLFGHKKGDVISIAIDEDAIPTSKYWRDRFKDANIDKCVEFVEDKDLTKKQK